jgi:peptidoglycan/LPS O-acetylase OafA/YrhL
MRAVGPRSSSTTACDQSRRTAGGLASRGTHRATEAQWASRARMKIPIAEPPDRFASLDGLRALAIAGVIWHHAAGRAFPEASILGRGRHGVTLFFALSGFLITSLLLREKARFGRISLGRFYARRSLRIFPLYYAVLALYAWRAQAGSFGADGAARFHARLPHYLTYTSNLRPDDRAPFAHSWSLAFEEQFYLLWPPLLVLLGVRRSAVLLCVLLGLNRIAEVAALAESSWSDHLGARFFMSLQTAIILGVLAAIVLRTARGRAILAAAFGSRFASPIALAALIAACAAPPAADYWMAVELASTALVLACVVREDHVLKRPLTWRPVRLIGTISYGMYLLHLLVQGQVLSRLPESAADRPVLRFTAVFGATTIVAAAVYFAFERPFLRWKERFAPGAPRRTKLETAPVGGS